MTTKVRLGCHIEIRTYVLQIQLQNEETKAQIDKETKRQRVAERQRGRMVDRLADS
jgi:hypothetical protein